MEERITNEEIKKVFRCPECNLVPLINYSLKESEENEEVYEQKINIICKNIIKEENKKNDSLCIKHNKKIEKI